MDIAPSIPILGGLLLAALPLYILSRHLGLPWAGHLILVGFIGSEILVALGIDTGVRAGNFGDLVFSLLLPALVFEAAVGLDFKPLIKDAAAVLVLAIPLLLLSTLLIGALVYAGINHPVGFPWTAALLTGALLSATDPSSLQNLFRLHGIPERLRRLLDGESLLNDAAAIVLFALVLELALQPDIHPQVWPLVKAFFSNFGLGLLIGLSAAGLARLLLLSTRHAHAEAFVGLAAAWGAWTTAQYFEVSAVMAVLACGLGLSSRLRHAEGDRTGTIWHFVGWLAGSTIFLLMGITVTVDMLEERWLAMLIGIAALLVSRFTGVWLAVPVIRVLRPSEPIPYSYRPLLALAGLRGVVALALALAIPVELDYWWTVQAIAFGVVLYTQLIQAPAVTLWLRHRHTSDYSS